MRIGIFDSGLGGLGVYKQIEKLYPQMEAYYISDLAYCPYGEKTQQQIIERCQLLTAELLSYNVKIIVIACNTATALAIDHLRQNFSIPFVGVEPYLNFVHQAQQQGITPFRPVVLLTQASATSERFLALKKKLNIEDQIDVFPCEGLANLIETGIHLKHEKQFLTSFKQILFPLQGKGYTHAILGCTHYPFLTEEIESYLQLTCVAPESYVAQRTMAIINEKGDERNSNSQDKKRPSLSTSRPLSLSFQQLGPHLSLAVTKVDPHLSAKLRCLLQGL